MRTNRSDCPRGQYALWQRVTNEMVSLASHILDTKAGHFDPSKFKDEYELALRKLVKRKSTGKTIEAPEEKEDRSNVIDLMEALRQSVKGKGRRFQSQKGQQVRAEA